jgi:hypothetical protein
VTRARTVLPASHLPFPELTYFADISQYPQKQTAELGKKNCPKWRSQLTSYCTNYTAPDLEFMPFLVEHSGAGQKDFSAIPEKRDAGQRNLRLYNRNPQTGAESQNHHDRSRATEGLTIS